MGGPLKNPKHESFVRNIVKGMSQREAYVAAGYTAKSGDVADAAASRLLADVRVGHRLRELQEKVTERAIEKAAVTKEQVLAELVKIGFANMLDYVRVQEGTGDAYVDLSKMTREQAAAIGEVVVEEYTEGKGESARDVKRVKFKLLDKKGALVDIGRELGMFINRTELGGPGDFAKMTDAELLDEDERLTAAIAGNLVDGPTTPQ
jgi:phage terminase small subunit